MPTGIIFNDPTVQKNVHCRVGAIIIVRIHHYPRTRNFFVIVDINMKGLTLEIVSPRAMTVVDSLRVTEQFSPKIVYYHFCTEQPTRKSKKTFLLIKI